MVVIVTKRRMRSEYRRGPWNAVAAHHSRVNIIAKVILGRSTECVEAEKNISSPHC